MNTGKTYRMYEQVEFPVGTDVYVYQITATHLSLMYEQDILTGEKTYHQFNNRLIFDILGMDREETEILMGRAYGYRPSSGDWPTYRTNDMQAANNAIQVVLRELGVEIEDFEEDYEAWQ